MMKKGLILFLCCLSFCSVQARKIPSLLRTVNQSAMNHWVDSVFDSMSEDERIAQLFMVAADPTTDTRNMQRLMSFVQEMKVGGVLFHKGEPETQAQVTNKIQKASRVPLFIALDGEWGLSMRMRGTTRFPKNM